MKRTRTIFLYCLIGLIIIAVFWLLQARSHTEDSFSTVEQAVTAHLDALGTALSPSVRIGRQGDWSIAFYQMEQEEFGAAVLEQTENGYRVMVSIHLAQNTNRRPVPSTAKRNRAAVFSWVR